VPDLRVRDAAGRQSSLLTVLADGPQDPSAARGAHASNDAMGGHGPQGQRVLIVDFVYTRCQTVCLALGSVFQQLQREIQAQGLQDRVGLLSISFDPANDTAEALRAYRDRMQMSDAVWRVVTLQDADDRRALLDSFGIVVIPAPNGEFEHNAALHVVTPAGALIHIVDIGDPQRALAAAAAGAAATAGTGLKP
jgi:protein SCO1/2